MRDRLFSLVRLVLGGAIIALAVIVGRRAKQPQITSTAQPVERSLAVTHALPYVPLRGRLPLVFVPAALLTGTVAFITIVAPRMAAAQPPAPPVQPIAFDHRVHTQVAGLDCAFCHRTAATGVTAGLPDVEQCMTCHQTVGQGQPEIEKVRNAWSKQQAIDWQRVHRLPDHTRFTHDAHFQAGVPCATCHGDVGNMQQVIQVRSLKMADCVACHQQNSAPTECSTCHF